MRIALIGTAGSGKSELAQKLELELGEAAILDDYMHEFEDDADLVLEKEASWMGELYILTNRWAAERKILSAASAEHLITCGTMIETAVHLCVAGADRARRDGVSDTQRRYDLKRVQTTMYIMGLWFGETFMDYDHAFWLAYEGDDEYSKKIDFEIGTALEAFAPPFTKLEGTVDDRITAALAVINKEPAKTE